MNQPGKTEKIIVIGAVAGEMRPGPYKPASLFTDPSVPAGYAPISDGLGNVSWGAVGVGSGALGYTASPDYSLFGSYNVAPAAGISHAIQIGNSAVVSTDYAIAIGYDAEAAGDDSVALGRSTECSAAADDGIAIGVGAQSLGFASIAMGKNAINRGQYCLVLGEIAETAVGSQRHTIVGRNAEGIGATFDSVAIGSNAAVADNNAIAIGWNSDVLSGGFAGVAIGPGAQVSASGAVAIGNSQNNAVANSVQFGPNAGSFLRFDDFTPAASATTPDYYIEVEFNAGRYRIPLESIP